MDRHYYFVPSLNSPGKKAALFWKSRLRFTPWQTQKKYMDTCPVGRRSCLSHPAGKVSQQEIPPERYCFYRYDPTWNENRMQGIGRSGKSFAPNATRFLVVSAEGSQLHQTLIFYSHWNRFMAWPHLLFKNERGKDRFDKRPDLSPNFQVL